MIAAFIVISSVVLALVFTVAYVASPDLRRRVEAPKYAFMDDLERYNADSSRRNGHTDENET